MRSASPPHLVILGLALVAVVSAAWTLPSIASTLREHLPLLRLQNPAQHAAMEPYNPDTAPPDEYVDPELDHKTGPIIADVLPKIRGVNIFASLTRDFEEIAMRLNDSSRNVTVLAPRNSAIQDLPRKPWENPADYQRFGEADAYKGPEGEDRAKKNLRRFVEAHLIPSNPWRKGDEIATIGGGTLRWWKDGGKIRIHPGDVEVDHIAAEVLNGQVWVLNGVLNYQ